MASITWTRRGNFPRLFFDLFSTSLSAVDFTRGTFLRSSAKNSSQFWFYFTSSRVFFIFVCSTARDALVRGRCFGLGPLFGYVHQSWKRQDGYGNLERRRNIPEGHESWQHPDKRSVFLSEGRPGKNRRKRPKDTNKGGRRGRYQKTAVYSPAAPTLSHFQRSYKLQRQILSS